MFLLMTVKSFKDYVQEREREYNLRIKTVVPLDDQELEYMERVLDKYVLRDITKPVKTILQKHPLDFRDLTNVEVWIVDIVTALPVSAYVLQQELKLALNIPEKYIVVRNANDPKEIETQRMAARDEIDMEAMEQGLSPAPRLSTNSAYDDDELGTLEDPVYGNDYNSRFLEVLAQVSSDRDEFLVDVESTELDEGGTVLDADDVAPPNAFNEDIVDAPEPKYSIYAETLKNLRKEGKIGQARLSIRANYDDDEIKQTKKYNKYGADGKKVAVVTVKNEREGIRKKS